MRRGDVFLADLEPVVGHEADKRRPVVVVTNRRSNASVERRGAGMVTVVPLTSNVTRVLEFQTLVPAPGSGLDRDSKAQAEQIRALDVRRLGRRLGTVPPDVMADLDRALRLHLAL